jgi:hypothetical protein
MEAYGVEMLGIPHCLDNRLKDGSKVVRQLCSISQKLFFFVSGAHFFQCLKKSQGLERLEGLSKLKNPMTSQGLELVTFRLVVVPQLTTLRVPPFLIY